MHFLLAMEAEARTLHIKHLPSELTKQDKEDLLQHFGATTVQCMRDTGKMKNAAFAVFPTHNDAKCAMSRLHQLEILGSHLVVEFAKPHHQKNLPHESDFKVFQKKQDDTPTNKISAKEEMRLRVEEFSQRFHAVAPHLGLEYISSPLLKYSYPLPTPSIITNIAHTLAAVPKFYTQVLHLMNKMNLPAPFGPITQAPPLQPDLPAAEKELVQNDVEDEEMNVTSSEESELESDEDSKKQEKPAAVKRSSKKEKKKLKKPKLKDLYGATLQPTSKALAGPTMSHTDVFDIPLDNQGAKKIQFNLKTATDADTVDEKVDIFEKEDTVHVEEGGFGVIIPQQANTEEKESESDPNENFWNESNFITKEELKKHRCSKSELRHISVFKNYQSGTPTYRLYIKNLARHVEEKDLKHIYGRYIDRASTTEKNMFDVRLMKEGRMKGQAFVTLATEQEAIQALDETNGYMLHGRPLVVQFARSARPKEQQQQKTGRTGR